MISIKYKEVFRYYMPDEKQTYDGSTKKITLTVEEIGFLYELLNRVQIQGIETAILLGELALKFGEHYTPPVDEEEL